MARVTPKLAVGFGNPPGQASLEQECDYYRQRQKLTAPLSKSLRMVRARPASPVPEAQKKGRPSHAKSTPPSRPPYHSHATGLIITLRLHMYHGPRWPLRQDATGLAESKLRSPSVCVGSNYFQLALATARGTGVAVLHGHAAAQLFAERSM